MKKQIPLFLIAGGCGFLVDACGVYLLNQIVDASPILIRALPFMAGIAVTFYLNYRFTFAGKATGRVKQAISKYMTKVCLVQSINLGIYTALVLTIPFFHDHPIHAVTLSAMSIVLLSFFLSKYWVFQKKEEQAKP